MRREFVVDMCRAAVANSARLGANIILHSITARAVIVRQFTASTGLFASSIIS
jgi:hypothetical protein